MSTNNQGPKRMGYQLKIMAVKHRGIIEVLFTRPKQDDI